MGKSILELFENAKVGELNTLPGIPLEVKGETAKERYDIRNSKDIRVSSSSPLLKLSFGAFNKIRLGTGQRKSETFLEQEISGTRVLRTLGLPIIYGTDIIRLITESTSVVEKMKNSANGGEGSGFTKFGQKIQATRDKIQNSKELGLPQPLNPTEYYNKFDLSTEGINPVYDRMIQIGEIKQNAAGSEFGKILKNSAGGAGAAGKQVLGNGLSSAKKALKNKILGIKGQSKNGNNDFSRLDKESKPYILYSQYEKYSDGSGYANRAFDTNEDKINKIIYLYDNKFESDSWQKENSEFGLNGNSKGGENYFYYNKINKFTSVKLSSDDPTKYFGYTSTNPGGNYLLKRASQFADKSAEYYKNSDWRNSNDIYKERAKDKSDNLKIDYFGTIREQYKFLSDNFSYPYKEKTGQDFGERGNEYLENGIFVIGKNESVVDQDQAQRAYGFRQKYYPDLKFTRNPNGDGNFGKATKELDPVTPTENGADNIGLGTDKVFPTITGLLGANGIDVNKLRPKPLNYKQKQDRPSYSKRKSDFYNTESETINGSLLDTRDSRGFGTGRDILNQLGVLDKNDLENIKINKKTLEKIDLIPVRFQRVNDGQTIYMTATISSFQETFTPNWEGKQMMGNPFKFYSYGGVERKVSFNLKVYALSQLELIMMWERLDHLAHMVYPFDVSTAGITPTLIYFTMGNLYLDKPSIVTSITYSVEDNENLWEIGGTDAKVRKNNFENGLKGKVKLNKNKVGVESGVNGMINSTYRYTIDSSQQVQTDFNREKTKRVIESEENIGVGDNPNAVPEGVNAQSKIWFDYVQIDNSKRVSMDTYKVPKFINVQLELTFLESTSIINSKLYSVGNPITLRR